jgi:hypothetical protein
VPILVQKNLNTSPLPTSLWSILILSSYTYGRSR